jgi:hypothetical protein
MILDEQDIYDRDWSWNFVSLSFEFLLFFNHGDVTWDSSKGESSKNQGEIFRHIVLGKVGGVVGTC